MRKSRALIFLTIPTVIFLGIASFLQPGVSNTYESALEEYEKLRTESNIPLSSINEWREKYLSSSDEIPVGSYLAVYFRRSDSNSIVHKENVPKAVLNYPWSNYHNLKAQEFGGYWVGDFDFTEDEIYYFHISQGHAQSRILVDGEIIYEGRSSKTVPFFVKAGRHRIEIQHENYSHAFSYSVNILPNKIYSSSPPSPTPSSTIWFAGVNESSKKNGEVTLLLKAAPTPIYLFLSSSSPVTWKIKQSTGAKLAGVYFSSYEPGTEVTISDPSVPIQQLSSRELPPIHGLDPQCDEHTGKFYCEYQIHPGQQLKSSISKLTGGLFASGFSGQYDSQALVVPEQTLSQRDYAKFAKKTEKLQKRGEKQQ